MKANKILLAMALPVAFAACSSEEIIENAGSNLQTRNVLPQITATVESGVDSRFSWNEENFAWNKFTAEDKFGAGLTDDVQWTEGNSMLTNYIFSDVTGNGAFTTTSQMVEGVYFFYSYPNFESVAKRGPVSFDLTSQTSIDFENPTAAVEQNQLFISHLYKLDAATANNALPVTFYSYWATAALKVKNTTGQSFKIVRAMLSNTDASGETFALKGNLKPADLGDSNKDNSKIKGLVYSYDAASNGYVLGYVDPTATTKVRADKEGIRTANIADVTTEDGKSSQGMLLDCGMYELADGEEALAYFQVPAGAYKDLEVTLFIEVTDEELEETEILELAPVKVEKNAKSTTTATSNDRIAMKRGMTTALFGVEEGEIAAYVVDEYAIMDGTEAGAYAASYDDLAAIVKAAEDGEIAVSNMGSLQVDDKVLKLMSTKANEYKVVKFLNSIDITSNATSATLTNVTFADGRIVKGKFNTAGDLGNVIVNPETELTVKHDQTGTITNKGIVNLSKANLAATVVDASDAEKEIATTVKVNNDMTINAVAGSGPKVFLTGAPTNLYLNNKGGNTPATDIVLKNITIGYGQNLYVASDVTVEGNERLVNNGYIENKGIISTLKNTGEENKLAEIENHGSIVTIHTQNAYAFVEQMLRTAELGAITYNEGTVDNTIGAFVGDAVTGVYAKYDGEDKTGLLGNVQSIDKIIVKNCTWTDAKLPTSYTGEIELVGVTLAKSTNGIPETTWSNVKISGNSTVNYDVIMNGEIKSTTFLGKLTTTVNKLQDVTVNGDLELTNTVLTLIGTTLNAATLNNVATLNVEELVVGTTYTAKTTTLNGAVTATSLTLLNIGHDATLIVENGASIGNNNTVLNISDAGAHTGSVAGKLLDYGTVTTMQ